MNTASSRVLALPVFALAWALAPLAAQADAPYPNKPITYVVPNAPGGSGDVIARTLSEKLAHDLGVPVIVENKAGATGLIGAQFVARAAPDGYTLLVSSTGPMAIVPSLQPEMPYNANTAFLPVIEIAQSHTVLVVSAKKPWHTVQDVIAAAKAAPGTMSFASGGNGTVLHLQGELLKMRTGIDMVHVPYKGDAPAVTDLLAGQVSMMFVPTQAVEPLVQAGQLRIIATTSAHRLKSLPNVPTMAESGIADFVSDAWFGAYVPAKTPPAVIARLNAAFNAALKDPVVAQRLQTLGLDVTGGEPSVLMTAQRTDMARWARVIQRAHIHASE
jgi:tripartite-type tricarboxylate transporter receptor subunit TctC